MKKPLSVFLTLAVLLVAMPTPTAGNQFTALSADLLLRYTDYGLIGSLFVLGFVVLAVLFAGSAQSTEKAVLVIEEGVQPALVTEVSRWPIEGDPTWKKCTVKVDYSAVSPIDGTVTELGRTKVQMKKEQWGSLVKPIDRSFQEALTLGTMVEARVQLSKGCKPKKDTVIHIATSVARIPEGM